MFFISNLSGIVASIFMTQPFNIVVLNESDDIVHLATAQESISVPAAMNDSRFTRSSPVVVDKLDAITTKKGLFTVRQTKKIFQLYCNDTARAGFSKKRPNPLIEANILTLVVLKILSSLLLL